MKLIIKLVVIAIVIYFAWSFFKSESAAEPLISFTDQTKNFSIKVRHKEKEEFKQYLGKIKRFIYREATVHNPQGDVLPDNLDDNLIEKTKKIVN